MNGDTDHKQRRAIVQTLLPDLGKVAVSTDQELGTHRREMTIKVKGHAICILIIVCHLRMYLDIVVI